jgi:hypothetical protein
MYAHLQDVREKISKSNVSVKDQIKRARRKIAVLQRNLDIVNKAKEEGEEDLDDKTILGWLRSLGRLRRLLAELEGKNTQAQATDAELAELASGLCSASEEFDSMKFERKKRLIRLSIDRAVLTQITVGWLQLDIHWSPYLDNKIIDRVLLFQTRGTGEQWTDDERRKLTRLYSSADRQTLLAEFPNRTWSGLMAQANILGLHREYMSDKLDMPLWMSMEDREIIDRYGIDLGEYFRYRPERYYDWQVLSNPEISTDS